MMKKLKIDSSAYIGENAVVMGAVEIGQDCSILPGAVIRGDMCDIFIGARSNIQDNAILHTDEGQPLRVEEDVTVGHGCILHGCVIKKGTLVGMGSIVLNGAVLEEGCILGAGSLVTSETVIPAGMLAFGRPAKVVRPLTEEEKAGNLASAAAYVAHKNSQLKGQENMFAKEHS